MADLRQRLLDLIGSGGAALATESEFDRTALAMFAYQFERNPVYRAFCETRGADPTTVTTWLEIPAVPTDAFKAAELVCGDPAAAAAVFRTSGTTRGGERRGTHYLLDTSLYEAALLAGFRAHLLPDRATIRIASLVPPADEVPDSSLSFMVSRVVRGMGDAPSAFHVREGALEVETFLDSANAAIEAGEPLLVIGTSFAFVHLLDALETRRSPLALPPGSRVMDTGGFKGRSREVSRADLYRMIETGLGVPGRFIVNEYGMTEMSSQLYDGVAGDAPPVGAERVHRGPPWTRSVAVDPETLRPLGPGELGVLRHLDLANLDSVMSLQTADLGRVTAEGIELRGRASGAEARGCSIAMDELLAAMEGR